MIHAPTGIFDLPPNPSAPVGAPPYEPPSPFSIASDSAENEEPSQAQRTEELAVQRKYMPPATPAPKKMILNVAKSGLLLAPESKPCVLPAPRSQIVLSPVPEAECSPIPEPIPEPISHIETIQVPATAFEKSDVFLAENSTNDLTPKINHALLRAIFGTSQDMSAAEVWMRCKRLPGILKLEILPQNETRTLEDMKNQLGTQPHMYHGKTPIEIIREGGITFAVTTNGGFAYGVRETLIIVAREFGTGLI